VLPGYGNKATHIRETPGNTTEGLSLGGPQVNVGHLNDSGVYTGQYSTFALCGFIRAMGDGDSALDRLWTKKKVEIGQL
jgi:hypothetical protein